MKTKYVTGTIVEEFDLNGSNLSVDGVKQDKLVIKIEKSLNYDLEGNKWNYFFLALFVAALIFSIVVSDFSGVVISFAVIVWQILSFREDIDLTLDTVVYDDEEVEE